MHHRLAAIRDRVLLKVTLVIYYYLPILYYGLRPSSRRSDIRKEYDGSATFSSGKYAVYVIWQPDGTIPWYVTNMLEGLKALGVNAIVVANHDLTPEQLSTLKEHSAKVLVRGNKGLDFGAYKDAIVYLRKQKSPVFRLLLMNDSVYVFRRGLQSLLERLLSDEFQVVAAYENWEKHYHFQSFCLAVSGDVVANPQFVEFWDSYRAIPIRRWCIDHGEVKLSERLRKVATRFSVCYRINDLLDLLESDREVSNLLLYREFVPKLTRGAFPADDFLEVLSAADPAQRRIILRRAKERISSLLIIGSQTHTGAFFFPKFLASPFLKRDLVYREQFNLYEVERMMTELGFVEQFPLITDEIRRRGTGGHYKGFKRRRFRLGLI